MLDLFTRFRAEFGTSQFRVEVLGYALALSIFGLCLVGVAVAFSPAGSEATTPVSAKPASVADPGAGMGVRP